MCPPSFLLILSSAFFRSPPSGCSLQAVNNYNIVTFVTHPQPQAPVHLYVGLPHRWHPVHYSRADFLHRFQLLVHVSNHRLVNSITHLRVNGVLSLEPCPQPCVPYLPPADPLMAILQEFVFLTSPRPKDAPIKHTVQHYISTPWAHCYIPVAITCLLSICMSPSRSLTTCWSSESSHPWHLETAELSRQTGSKYPSVGQTAVSVR